MSESSSVGAQEFDFSKRIPQLDGLRGIAIGLVLLFHFFYTYYAYVPARVPRLFAPLGIAWCGVDLFFVLSGFLIGGILLDARSSPNYFRTFYTRRVCRIFPLYFIFLAVIAIFFRAEWSGSPWWSCAFFVQNFWTAFHSIGGSALEHTWSLAVEEQFYLTLPALIYFARPKQLPRILTAGILLAVVARLACFFLLRDPRDAIYRLLPCRMDSLLVGVATAWALRRPGAAEVLRARRRQLWTAMELLTLASATFFLTQSQGSLLTTLVVYDALALLFACAIATSFVDPGLARILTQPHLMALGSIAYGTYVLHPIIWRFTYRVFPALGYVGAAIVAVGGTIVVAKLSWEYFEKPIVRFGHQAVYSQRARLEVPAPMGSPVVTQFVEREGAAQ